MKSARLYCPTNIRLDNESKRRLATVARRFNLTASGIIRAALVAKLPEWERGNITLTPLSLKHE